MRSRSARSSHRPKRCGRKNKVSESRSHVSQSLFRSGGPGGGTASRQRQSRFTSGTNCDTGRPESAPSDENRLPNPPARTLRTNRSRSRFYFLSLAVKTTSLSAAGQERPVPHHAAALKTETRHGQSEPRPDIAAPPRGAGQLRRRVGLAHPARRRHRPHLLPRGEIVPASGDTCPATHQRPDPDDVGRPSVRRQSPARRLPSDSARPPISAAAAGLRRRPLAAETAAQRLLDLPHRRDDRPAKHLSQRALRHFEQTRNAARPAVERHLPDAQTRDRQRRHRIDHRDSHRPERHEHSGRTGCIGRRADADFQGQHTGARRRRSTLGQRYAETGRLDNDE